MHGPGFDDEVLAVECQPDIVQATHPKWGRRIDLCAGCRNLCDSHRLDDCDPTSEVVIHLDADTATTIRRYRRDYSTPFSSYDRVIVHVRRGLEYE